MARDFFNADMELLVDQRVDWARYVRFARPGADWQEELATHKMVLRTAGALAAAIEDASRDHWHEPARLEDGAVVLPPHVAAGYARLREAGLVALPVGADHGGSGLPFLVNSAYLEMLARADPSLMTIIGLQAGVAHDLERYGSEALKRRYLPRFASGELQGCMDLTEPEAGSDLGNIATRATAAGDRYRVEGEKIFITNGGADVHLVLARDAATVAQTRGTTNGLSLILCPRTLPDGRANAIRVARVEAKLGLHGSPTCAVRFDGAEGWLVGKPGQGFRAILDLMHNARLGVAAQAVGIAEGAYREARDHAARRVQFGAPILEQPLVKSMLAQMAIHVQAARALLYRTCALVDLAGAMRDHLASAAGAVDPRRAELAVEQRRTARLARVLTPLCKYYASELANEVARRGVQVQGGLGYMATSRAGHYLADAIVTTIYEGTSEIQASFALREMGGGGLATTLDAVGATLAPERDAHPDLAAEVARGVERIRAALPALHRDPRYALLNAKRVCDMVIDVVVAAELLAQARHSEARRALAASFVHRRLPVVGTNAERIAGGDVSRLQRYDAILGPS